jgi:catechol 2,3-dioxygenase-like lactoylglutathione lyase family enzyme
VILGFSHAQLVVRDVEVSAAWYCHVLGLESFVSGELASGPYVGLRHPTARFVIGLQTATAEELVGLGSSAIHHLSFAVADLAALMVTRARLDAEGIAVGEVFDEAVSHNLRLRDPDGMVLELTAPRARPTGGG